MTQPRSIKGRALSLLSVREHTRAELEKKLKRHEVEPGSLTEALDQLQRKGLISHQRVIESVLHQRAPKWGSLKIEYALKNKGLEPDAITEALLTLKSTEQARALAVWQQKYKQKSSSPQEEIKQIRFMVGRGFTTEIIHKVLKSRGQDLEDGQ